MKHSIIIYAIDYAATPATHHLDLMVDGQSAAQFEGSIQEVEAKAEDMIAHITKNFPRQKVRIRRIS